MNNLKTPVTVLCYGDSNTWGWVAGKMGTERYPFDNRWPGVLQKSLGSDYVIIEEALGGRMTAFNDPRPEFPHRNGHDLFPIILESHAPIDIVIVMLGTADCKALMGLSAQDIATGMQQLILDIKNIKVVNNHPAPKIILLAPAVVSEDTELMHELFKGAGQKSAELVNLYADLALQEDIIFFDTNNVTKVDETEGVHITAESHVTLGNALVDLITKLTY